MQRVHQDEATREQLMLDLVERSSPGGSEDARSSSAGRSTSLHLEAGEGERDEHGRALLVGKGYARSREILCGVGTIEVRAPRINDKWVDETTGERMRSKSAILPPGEACAAL